VRVRACQQPTTGISHGIYSEKKTVVKKMFHCLILPSSFYNIDVKQEQQSPSFSPKFLSTHKKIIRLATKNYVNFSLSRLKIKPLVSLAKTCKQTLL